MLKPVLKPSDERLLEPADWTEKRSHTKTEPESNLSFPTTRF